MFFNFFSTKINTGVLKLSRLIAACEPLQYQGSRTKFHGVGRSSNQMKPICALRNIQLAVASAAAYQIVPIRLSKILLLTISLSLFLSLSLSLSVCHLFSFPFSFHFFLGSGKSSEKIEIGIRKNPLTNRNVEKHNNDYSLLDLV